MFLIGNDFVWTKQGIRRIGDVENGNEILGIDREGNSLWLELNSPPLLRGKKELLIHIILDRSEIRVAPSCELCGPEGIIRAKELKQNDKLEIFSEPRYIFRELEKPATDFVDRIYIKGYGTVPLTVENGYLLGILSQHTVVPALWSTGSMIIKVPTGGAEWVAERLKTVVSDFKLVAIRGDRHWSCIEFKSSIVNLVQNFPSLKTIFSKVLRSNYTVLHSFLKGLVDIRSIPLENIRRVVTKLEEVELRKLLYNFFFIHSVRCFTTLVRYPEHNLCYIDIPSSDLANFYEKKNPSRTLSAWTNVKGIYRTRGEMYALPRSRKIYWSPVIDLVLLAC
jgi:hypothetical protein